MRNAFTVTLVYDTFCLIGGSIMGAITKEMIEKVYEEGVKLYNGSVTLKEAKENINQSTNMDLGSCNAYLTVLCSLLNGVEYHRTANALATEYFLINIEKDFGTERRKKAANAVKMHTEYYATLGHGHQRKIEKLADMYK